MTPMLSLPAHVLSQIESQEKASSLKLLEGVEETGTSNTSDHQISEPESDTDNLPMVPTLSLPHSVVDEISTRSKNSLLLNDSDSDSDMPMVPTLSLPKSVENEIINSTTAAAAALLEQNLSLDKLVDSSEQAMSADPSDLGGNSSNGTSVTIEEAHQPEVPVTAQETIPNTTTNLHRNSLLRECASGSDARILGNNFEGDVDIVTEGTEARNSLSSEITISKTDSKTKSDSKTNTDRLSSKSNSKTVSNPSKNDSKTTTENNSKTNLDNTITLTTQHRNSLLRECASGSDARLIGRENISNESSNISKNSSNLVSSDAGESDDYGGKFQLSEQSAANTNATVGSETDGGDLVLTTLCVSTEKDLPNEKDALLIKASDSAKDALKEGSALNKSDALKGSAATYEEAFESDEGGEKGLDPEES